jgi:hypothetical protein
VPNQHLGVYLNDHLAGSTAALELLDVLRNVDGHEEWASRVRTDIAEDRQELEQLMRHLGIAEKRVRQAAAWVTEKLAELKTRIDDRSGGALQRLELIEALALGIDGKRALWTALEAAAADVPALRALDYARLVEVRRLQAASEALSLP